MQRFTTLAAFSGAALLSASAFAAQNNGLASYNDNDALTVKVSINDADGPARDQLVLSAYRDEDTVLDYAAQAAQSATRLQLSLAFPAQEHTGAEFLYVDVLEPGGFQIYEIMIRVEDLTVFVNDYTDGSADAGDDFGPDIDDSGDSKKDPGQDVPIGNPYGPDVLFPPATGKPQFLYPSDPELDFGDGSQPAGTSTIPVDDISDANDPSGSFDDFDVNPDDDGPPIGNPYGPDMVWPDTPLQDYNSQSDPAGDFGDGSGGGFDPFAPGDGDLGTDPDDYTQTAAPNARGQQSLQDLNGQLDTGDGGNNDPFAPGDGDLGTDPNDLTLVAAPSGKAIIAIIEPSFALFPGDYSGQTPTAAYPQPSGFDCNNNGQDDAYDIAADAGLDMNSDGRIDRCVLSGDLDLSGEVDVMDLIVLMSGWGTCFADNTDECAGDLDGDGLVNEYDLTQLFNHWTN